MTSDYGPPPGSSKRNPLILISAGVGVLLLVLIVLVVVLLTRGGNSDPTPAAATDTGTPDPVITTPSTIIVRGSMTVPADTGKLLNVKGDVTMGVTPCQSADGYGDIEPGAQVTIRDNSGNTVALGQLEAGKVAETGKSTILLAAQCAFPFEVSGVPDSPFYSVEVAHRGQVNETRSEMFGSVDLSVESK